MKILKLHFLFIILIFSAYSSIFSIEKLANKELVVRDIKDSVYQIVLKKDIAVVFYNNINCSECFLELNDYFEKNKSKFQNIYCIMRSNSNNKYSERMILNEAKKLFKADYYFFDIHDDDDSIYDIRSGVFHDYKVSKTPAMIYVGDTVKFISYDILFSEQNGLAKIINKMIKK